MPHSKGDPRSFVIEYLTLRKVVGILGFSLPITLLIGGMLIFGKGIQPTISHYYHTGMGDVFVGTLCAMGVFLASYRGHDRRDDRVGNVACLFAVGVALFPTSASDDPGEAEKVIGMVHLACAALFFLTLAYFSICLFTLTEDEEVMSAEKRTRNLVYRICGWTIVAAILLIALLSALPESLERSLRAHGLVFWLEAIAVFAFGFSWFVKGETLWKDSA